MKHTKVLLSLTILSLGFTLSSNANAQTNIALNKKIITNIPSNYALTKDKNPAQLVDGKYAGNEYNAAENTSSLWVQEGAITWRSSKSPVIFTIDLGKEMPVSGVSFSTAAGRAGVQFPSFVGIAVSEDGKTWFYQGNLISMSRQNGTPDLNKYSRYKFATHDLKTKGRYVSLAVMQFPYTVTDEIEIYSGDNAWLTMPLQGKSMSSLTAIKDLATVSVEENFVKRRVDDDIKTIRQKINDSALPDARKSTFMAQLDKSAAENEQFALTDANLSTVLPINPIHQKVMETYGAFLAAEKVPQISIWKEHRYAWTPFIAKPQNGQKPQIDISMLGNQFRSDAFLITNASDAPEIVSLKLQNSPAGAKAGWLQINQAIWMDTYQGTPVADALLPVALSNGLQEVTIPAGFTAKIWLTVDSSKVPAGKYKSTFMVNGTSIPFNLNISNIAMKRPRMSLCVWDYTDPASMKGSGSRGITSANYAAALAMMKSHFVDSPWATRGILPFPTAEAFDANNQLKSTLSFTNFDKWVAEWPDARNYFVFISAKEEETFGGSARGTAAFKARLGNWAKVLSAHMKKLNLDPAKLALLIVDEPHQAWQDEVIADWASAINAAAPELSLICDPSWVRPEEEIHQAALSQMDMLMPNTQRYVGSYSKASIDYFDQQYAAGKELWLYSCTGPVRLFDPQQYYRGQAWRVFSMNGKGMGYWAFGDIGSAPSTWQDYQINQSFSPAFIDKNTVYNSIHWDSVREGVEDFEELSMLHDAIENTKNAALKIEAQKVLDEAVKVVTATKSNDDWQKEMHPEYTDQQLHNVRDMLEKLQ